MSTFYLNSYHTSSAGKARFPVSAVAVTSRWLSEVKCFSLCWVRSHGPVGRLRLTVTERSVLSFPVFYFYISQSKPLPRMTRDSLILTPPFVSFSSLPPRPTQPHCSLWGLSVVRRSPGMLSSTCNYHMLSLRGMQNSEGRVPHRCGLILVYHMVEGLTVVFILIFRSILRSFIYWAIGKLGFFFNCTHFKKCF